MKELAWCDAVPIFLLAFIFSIFVLFEPAQTINSAAWWAASWWPTLRLGLVVWGIARFIDLLIRGPVRRANKRHRQDQYRWDNLTQDEHDARLEEYKRKWAGQSEKSHREWEARENMYRKWSETKFVKCLKILNGWLENAGVVVIILVGCFMLWGWLTNWNY